MIGKLQKQVRDAEGRRQQASMRLRAATERWRYQKRNFFANPVNLLLPFTAGALLASKGSAAKQAVDWSRAIGTGAKILLAAYPLIQKSRERSTSRQGNETENA